MVLVITDPTQWETDYLRQYSLEVIQTYSKQYKRSCGASQRAIARRRIASRNHANWWLSPPHLCENRSSDSLRGSPCTTFSGSSSSDLSPGLSRGSWRQARTI